MFECEFQQQCGFYLKYRDRTSLAWRGLIKKYCLEAPIRTCRRKGRGDGFCLEGDDELMPTGQKVPLIFLDLP